MIIKIETASAATLDQAWHDLQDLTRAWGHEITNTQSEPAAANRGDGKGVDWVALATLVASLPSAALAAADLADRIRKLRRAKELIGKAQQLAAQQVTITLIAPGSVINLATITPDQLLDLQATQELPSDPAATQGNTRP